MPSWAHKRKRPNTGALPNCIQSGLQAASLVGRTSRTLLELVIGIARGFIASGISRTRSMCRSPFSRLAPLTCTWSASWKRSDGGKPPSPLTVVAERIEGGKLRVTCPSWDDVVVIHPAECLALVNIERQVHVLRAKAPLPAQAGPPAAPDPGETGFWMFPSMVTSDTTW
jgi:hypothetical protein